MENHLTDKREPEIGANESIMDKDTNLGSFVRQIEDQVLKKKSLHLDIFFDVFSLCICLFILWQHPTEQFLIALCVCYPALELLRTQLFAKEPAKYPRFLLAGYLISVILSVLITILAKTTAPGWLLFVPLVLRMHLHVQHIKLAISALLPIFFIALSSMYLGGYTLPVLLQAALLVFFCGSFSLILLINQQNQKQSVAQIWEQHQKEEQRQAEAARIEAALEKAAQAEAAKAEELKRVQDQLERLRYDSKELAQSKEELEQALQASEQEKYRLKESESTNKKFFAQSTHELRTPLTAIIGYTDMILEEYRYLSKEELIADVKRIQGAGNYLLSLVNNHLDLSKVDAGKIELHPTLFDLSQMIQNLTDLVQPLAKEKSNDFVLYFPERINRIYIDQIRLQQILFNFISNAIKFTDNGTITLAVMKIQKDGQPHIRFSVTDTGIGMSEEQLPKVFKTYAQASATIIKKYGGTGLGLAITRKLCALMDGEIKVKSQKGKGTSCAVSFPFFDVEPVENEYA